METESIEAITGIAAVDHFLSVLPEAWKGGAIDPNPRLYAFDAAGAVNVVDLALTETMATDDAMDLKANAWIAYIRTAHPVAAIVVSEMFVFVSDKPLTEPLDRVDCNRFEKDLDYQAAILAKRLEVLGAVVQTPEHSWQVRWPILRDAGKRPALGSLRIDETKGSRGRLLDLFHKAHAGDQIVERVPDALRERAPFAGKSIEELRPSTASMLTELDPRTSEGHTLDVLPDLRLILGLFGPDLSVMALNFGGRRPISELRARILEVLSRLLNESILEAHVRETTKGYIHYGALALRIGWK